MFSIQQQKVTLYKLDVHSDKHQKKPTGGVDLRVQYVESNGLLAEFHPALRAAMYRVDDTTPQQNDLPAVSPADSLTLLKFGDLIEKLSLKHELKGANVVIGFGLGGGSDIDLETVNVNDFKVTLLEGGSVRLSFRVQCKPTGEQVKKLYEVLGGEIDITVSPAVEAQASLLDE